jgi:hypothetical protein
MSLSQRIFDQNQKYFRSQIYYTDRIELANSMMAATPQRTSDLLVLLRLKGVSAVEQAVTVIAESLLLLHHSFWGYFYFFVLYLTLLHLPPLRFHCADGCWDRTVATGALAVRRSNQ